MITLVWRTDVHLADQAPQSRTDNWTDTVLDKLCQVGDIAKAHNAHGVLDGGDLFHIKSPSRNSHELVRKVMEVHQGYPCPTWGTVGNHDVKYGSLEFLGESPLGSLFESEVIRPLYLPTHEAVFEQDGVKVRVVAIPYHGTEYDRNRFSTITKGDEDWLVVIAHVLASGQPQQGEFFFKEDVLRYIDLANLDPDLWLFGHWHKDQGISRIGKKTFVNLGSITRGALTQDELTRNPKVALIRFQKTGFVVNEIPLHVKAAAEVFNIEGKLRAERRESTMETFVESLKTTLVKEAGPSLLDEVRSAEVPDLIRERTIGYLERAGAK